MIHTLYAAEEDPRPQVMENTIPISQILDMPGVDEDCQCDVRFEPISWDMQPQPDIDGGNSGHRWRYNPLRNSQGISEKYSGGYLRRLLYHPRDKAFLEPLSL